MKSVGELKILINVWPVKWKLLSITFLLVLHVYKVALTFESDKEILKRENFLNKTSLAALWHGAIHLFSSDESGCYREEAVVETLKQESIVWTVRQKRWPCKEVAVLERWPLSELHNFFLINLPTESLLWECTWSQYPLPAAHYKVYQIYPELIYWGSYNQNKQRH